MPARKAEYPVKMTARLLEVSRSGFCSWLANGAPTDEWGHVHDAVERVWLESDCRFGARMVHAFLPPEPGPAGALPRAQVHARAGHTRRDAQCQEAHHDTRWGRAPEAGPSGARLHRPRAHLQVRGRHHLPAHGAGLAVPGHRDRPQHPHGGRVGVCPSA